MEALLLSFFARTRSLRARGKRLLATAEKGPPPRAGIPQRRQPNFGGICPTIKRLTRPLHPHPAVGHFVVPVETAKETEGRFQSGSAHFDAGVSGGMA